MSVGSSPSANMRRPEGTGSHTGEAGGTTQDRGTGVTQDENRKKTVKNTGSD